MKVCHNPSRKTFVHVNMMLFRRNRKLGQNEPAITVKNGPVNYYGFEARVTGPSYIEYSGNDKPLIKCGARAAVTSRYPVEVLDTFRADAPTGDRFLRILGGTIRSNKLGNDLDPVVELHEEGTVTSGYGAKIDGDLTIRQCKIDGKLCLVIETDAPITIDTVPPAVVADDVKKTA